MASDAPVHISVEPQHLPQYSVPGREVFRYIVRIENLSDETWQLMRRHWRIQEGNGAEVVVDGEGVVGQQPILAPGGVFVYDSAVTVATLPAQMSGHYELHNAWGQRLQAAIPPFGLDVPGRASRLLN